MKPTVGDFVSPRKIESVASGTVPLPHPNRLTHLQFRRFAGCPICHLHLQTFIRRWSELEEGEIEEVAVFHSSRQVMLDHHADAPFPLIADPEKALYKVFGVEKSLASVLHPSAMLSALQGLLAHGPALPGKWQSPLGLPADFLIRSDGQIVALKCGSHAYDQWSVDEVLAKAREVRARLPPGPPLSTGP